MCIKAINTCSLLFDSVPDQYKNREACDKAVNHFLSALNFVSDWFVTRKILKSFITVYSQVKILIMSHFLVVK